MRILGRTVLAAVVCAACGGQTTAATGTPFVPPETVFDYAPEQLVSSTGGWTSTNTYSYDAARRLVRQTRSQTLPETPRTVITLTYGENDRLERVVTETFWGATADPSQRETEVWSYDAQGRLAGKEVTGENVGRNEPASIRTISIERDEQGRPVRVQEQDQYRSGEFAYTYDAETGHVATVTGPYERLALTFDELGRISLRLKTWLDGRDSPPERRTYAYDAQGFVSLACESLTSEESCSPEIATLTFTRAPAAPGGTPIELVTTGTQPSHENRTTISYTTAGTSFGHQQLGDGGPIYGFVLDLYGRGEIDSLH